MLFIQLPHGSVAAHRQMSTIADSRVTILLPLSLNKTEGKNPTNIVGCFPSQIKLISTEKSIFTKLLTVIPRSINNEIKLLNFHYRKTT